MDILTSLDNKANYSAAQLQWIFAAWVVSGVFDRKRRISLDDGDISEEDYDKGSIYSLLYSLYRSMGEVTSETGARYEATFNTWGYTWPDAWGPCPNKSDDPQRFGKNAYTGLYQSVAVKERVREKNGKVHIVEMGCGTGAGAHHVCSKVLTDATYEAVDMQQAAIRTCERKFVPELDGRLRATCANATALPIAEHAADIIAVNETHVTEMRGVVTDEDKRFFAEARRVLKPGGYVVWGNAIPTSTWEACFDYLKGVGMKVVEVKDVTEEAIAARDQDKGRIDAFAEQCRRRFYGFRLPVIGKRKHMEASVALKNFCRNPGTRLYKDMQTRADTYNVAVLQKSS